MFLLNTNNYFRVRVRVRVSVLLNTFTPQFSVGEPTVRINSDILVSAKLQLYHNMTNRQQAAFIQRIISKKILFPSWNMLLWKVEFKVIPVWLLIRFIGPQIANVNMKARELVLAMSDPVFRFLCHPVTTTHKITKKASCKQKGITMEKVSMLVSPFTNLQELVLQNLALSRYMNNRSTNLT